MALLERTRAVPGDVGTLLRSFASAQVPELSEKELSEMERVLWLTESELLGLIRRPGADGSRPFMAQKNTMLDRFLNYARFRGGAGEFR